MEIRVYDDGDIQSIIGLANSSNKETYEFIPLTRKSFEAWIQESSPLILISEDTRLQGFAIVERGWPAEPDEVEVSMLCTEEGVNSSSIERSLLEECERITSAKGIVTTLPIGHPKTTRYEDWGFELDGGRVHLIKALRKLPSPPQVMDGVRIRGLRKGEEEEFLGLINTSYGRPRLSIKNLETWQHDDPFFNYDWIQVAEYRGRLIGAGVARRDLEYNEYYHAKRGYLGPSGTLPEFRGRGLNRAINWYAMDFVRQKGIELVSLYTHEENFAVLKLTYELGYTLVYHWKLLKRRAGAKL